MKLPKFSSLYGRIFAIFWLTMLLVLIAVVAASQLDPRQLHNMPPQGLDKIQKTADKITKHYKDADSIDTLLVNLEHKEAIDKTIELYFADSEKRWLNSTRGSKQKALNNFITLQDGTNSKPQQKLYDRFMVAGPVSVTVAQQELEMYVGMRWHRPPPFLLDLLDRPFRLLLVVMLSSTPLLLWLAWALSRPAMRLEKAAQKVARGELEVDPTLEKQGPSEFRQAGTSFNQMVLSINNKITEQQRLLSDISHELRSPLTRLRMANALATRKQGESSEHTRIDTEADRLETMINELLELSRRQIDAHQIRQDLTAADLWQEMIDDGQFEAEQQGKQLHCSSIPNSYLTGNPSLLTSAVENIIRNAIRYCEHNVWVKFSQHGDYIQLDIEDDGEGVEEHELDAIFRPFYRVSTARERHTGGTGLGLAITQNAVIQHNGKIKASKSQHGGLAVEIKLPISRNS